MKFISIVLLKKSGWDSRKDLGGKGLDFRFGSSTLNFAVVPFRECLFFCFPSFVCLCFRFPCAVVFQVVAFCFFCFFWSQKFLCFVFPSFLSLPTDLFALILLSRPGLHTVILIVQGSCKRDAILFTILHFILLWASIQQVSLLHVFLGFFRTSFDEFDPIFFCFTVVDFFVFIFLERNITVLVTF